jgi:exosortase
MAIGALVVAYRGPRQLLHWWLPVALLLLSVPLPQMVLGKLALPLQLQASAIGANLLEARSVPVAVDGNIIRLPGHSLFVAEACSGLRSLTALLSLGVLMGGLFLGGGWSRAFIVLLTIPLAVVVNGVRVFLTGFLVFFVDPSFGQGFMHYTEGWALFMFSFLIVGGVTWLLAQLEGWIRRPKGDGGAVPRAVPA